MAAAQAERAEALRAAEEANRRRARFRVVAFGLLAAVAVVAAGLAWLAESQRREAVEATQLAVQATIKADAEKKRAEEEKGRAENEKGRADEELKKAQIAESRLLAGKAREALEAGEYTKAALLALEALPEPGAPTQRPIVDGVPELLYDAASAIRETSMMTVGRTTTLKRADSRAQRIALSSDGRRLMITRALGGTP
jgi:hypothetical protein